jgi:hypothetical protein
MEAEYLDEMRRLLMEACLELSTTHQLEFKSFFSERATELEPGPTLARFVKSCQNSVPRSLPGDLLSPEIHILHERSAGAGVSVNCPLMRAGITTGRLGHRVKT